MGSKLGNLIKNGSFELGLLAWHNENVITKPGNSHSGSYRAILGGTNQLQASLVQDIRISRKHCYLLSIFASAEESAGDLHIQISWLDKKGSDLGIGLNFDIPGKSIAPLPLWSYYLDITDRSPDEAKFARLSICKDAGGLVSLDDLLFFSQGED